jgi:hypothetical protein
VLCFCGDTYGTYGKSDNCTLRCTGNSKEICGTFWSNSVYDVNVLSGPISNANDVSILI